MKNLILFFVISFFLLSCRKEETENDNDTLKQYVEFTLNGKTFEFIENDSISFRPSWAFNTSDSDTNYLFYISSNIEIIHNRSNYTNVSSFRIVFYSKISDSQTQFAQNEVSEKLLKPGVFNSLFFPSQIEYLKQNCIDSINNGLFVGLIFPSFEESQQDYITFFNGCDEMGNDIYNSPVNSYFNIEEVNSYDNIRYGESLLLTGTFKANLHSYPNTEESTFLEFENGKFSILVSDPSNVFHYEID